MSILDKYYDDVRRLDVYLQGRTSLLLNRHLSDQGRPHPSGDLKHCVYPVPGRRGQHGIWLPTIQDIYRTHANHEGYQKWNIDLGLDLAGEHGFARIIGDCLLTHRRSRPSMAGYMPWTIAFSIFYVRHLFDTSRLVRLTKTVGLAGIGDDTTGRHGHFDLLEARVYLNDEFSYRQYKAQEV